MKFFVPGPLPGLNEIIAASKKELPWLRNGKNRVYEITVMKKKWSNRVEAYAILAHNEHSRGAPTPYNRPVAVQLEWIEPNNKRDPDNVFAGVKFVLDGLVNAGILKNDTRKWILAIDHTFGVNDKLRPGVYVRLI